MRRMSLLLLALLTLFGCTANPGPAGTPPAPASTAGPSAPAPATATGPQSATDQVAFIRGGNLWVRPLAGSERQLTDGGGYSNPAFSASGRWVMARRGDQLWTVNLDTAAQVQLPMSGRTAFVAWSPDTDRIAYRTDYRIGIINADGTAERTLATLKAPEVVSRLAWSPDGKWIGYDLNGSFPGSPPGTGTPSGIRRVSPDGGDPTTIYTATGDSPQCVIMAGWSADSASMLFWPQPMCSGSLLADGTALMSVPAAGGAPRQLVAAMLTHPDFLAVAKTGAVAVTSGSGRIAWAGKWIDVVTPGATVTRVTPTGTAAMSPAWSPDGQQIAYTAMTAAASNVSGGDQAREALSGRRIWIADADGRSTRQLTNTADVRDEAPLWSSSGKVLFVRMSADNHASLWLIPAEGGEATEVAAIDGPPDWFGFYGWIDWSQFFSLWVPGRSNQ